MNPGHENKFIMRMHTAATEQLMANSAASWTIQRNQSPLNSVAISKISNPLSSVKGAEAEVPCVQGKTDLTERYGGQVFYKNKPVEVEIQKLPGATDEFEQMRDAFAAYHGDAGKLGIIHFDAHYDLYDEYDGHKWSHACTEARALENGVVRPEDLFFIGIRVADLDELELIKKNPGITTVTAMDIHEKGIEPVLRKLESHFKGYDAIYLTLDIDGLDPAFAPGTGTPVMGGVTAIQLIKLFRWIIANLPVKAMDIVEVAPDLDVNNITSWAALKIIHELFTAYSR